MPPQTVEFLKNQQKSLVQHLFFDHEVSLSDNDVIAQIDPDLSVTSGLIAKRMESTGGRGCAPYVERLLNVGLVSMIRNIPRESDPKIPKKRTSQDLRALQQIDSVINTLSPRVPFTDRQQADINERALTMFRFITEWRPDLMAHPKFPWDTAVNLALSRPVDNWFGTYDHRVNILSKAPEVLVQKAMGDYANDGKNILETLYYELPLGNSGMPETSPKLWEVIRRAPDGNLPLAQSTLLWALRVQSHAMLRVQEQCGEPITKDVLFRTWKLARKKWSALSQEDRGNILTIDILYYYQIIYRNIRESGKKPPPTIDQMLQNMIHTTSDMWKWEFTQSLIAYVKAYPEVDLDMITEWFPIIAGIAEAHRPKTLSQKFTTLFHRS